MQFAILFRLVDLGFAVRAFELNGHANVLRFGGQPSQTESQRVGTEFVDDVNRVHTVPFTLRHRFAVAVEDFGVDVDFFKRNFANVV